MAKTKTIIFDLGGVVITMDHKQAVRRFEEIGLKDAERRLDPYTQAGIFGDVECGKISDETFRQELSSLVGRDVSWDECQYGWKGYFKELPRRNVLALRALRSEGYRLVLLSNTNPFIMRWALSPAFDGEGHALSDYFDALYLSYECRLMKPSEQFFRHVLESEHLRPDEAIFLDDSPRNAAAATALGIPTICPENGSDWSVPLRKLLAQQG